MIVEQIRYYIEEQDKDETLLARREETRVRVELGLPPGHILVADPGPPEVPALVWQCIYEDESAMAAATAKLIGNAGYEAIRERLRALTLKVELELYTADEDGA
jgi:hypothetical protein